VNKTLHTMQFISFRTYGTWLRGDERGWQARGARFGEALELPNRALEAHDQQLMLHERYLLSEGASQIVLESLQGLCRRRGWNLLSVSIADSHVHVLLLASKPPRRTLGEAKSFATRALREAGHIANDRPPWSRGGSAQVLLLPTEVEQVKTYILEEQGETLVLHHE
jgi:hypothetical protein